MQRRALGLIAVAMLALGAGLALRAAGTLRWLERSTVDARFSLRGARPAPAGVVVVGLDENSLGNLPRYPFSRRLHARVIERLHAAGARLIVYDISFDRPTTTAADRALYEAAARAAPMVFATGLISPGGATEVLGGDANLARIGDRAAAASLLPDGDGVLRHLLDRVNGLGTVAAVVGALNGRPPDRARLHSGWIDFDGPAGTVRNLSFMDVLRDRFNPHLVRGRVVVVGATAPVLQDLHRVSAGGEMPGPEVQAEAIATVLRGFPLRDPPGAVTILLLVALALLLPLAGMRLGTLGVGVVAIAALLLWSLGVQAAFDRGVVLDYGDPLTAVLLGGAGTVAITLWAERDERRRLRRLFAAGASSVVDRVLGDTGPKPLEPTAIIAGYRIEEEVGRGGMGVVYRATQLALDRAVAIKLIAAERSQDPLFRARFKRESQIAASIEHASVIPVYEAGEDDGLLFIAMRLVDGMDLAQRLQWARVLDPPHIARLANQLAGALDAAHARGLVHRDVKPANILLTSDRPEHAYLTDFGVAKLIGADEQLTRADRWVGTLDYLAPELIRGEPVGPFTDVYALAGVLYRCLTGQVPYPREDEPAKLWAHVNAPPPLPSKLKPDLPAALDEAIARGMAKDPAERFASASELASAFSLGLEVEAVELSAAARLEEASKGVDAKGDGLGAGGETLGAGGETLDAGGETLGTGGEALDARGEALDARGEAPTSASEL